MKALDILHGIFAHEGPSYRKKLLESTRRPRVMSTANELLCFRLRGSEAPTSEENGEDERSSDLIMATSRERARASSRNDNDDATVAMRLP